MLLCPQYSYSITFLNLNLFSRSSIQLSNVIVLRIYNQIIVFQELFLSASSFASDFCNLKRIFLLWSHKLHHSKQSCHTVQDQFYLVKEVHVSRCSDILHNRTKWNKIKSNQMKWNWIGIPLVSEEVEFWNVCPERNAHCIYSHQEKHKKFKVQIKPYKLCQYPSSISLKSFAYLEIRTGSRDVPAGLLILQLHPRTKKLFSHRLSSGTVKKHEHEQVKHAAFSAAAKGLSQKSWEDFKAGFISVLIMAERELMFFIVACIGLCLCPKQCWQHRDILSISQ